MMYPSDLSDKQWDMIKDLFTYGNYGKSAVHAKRDLVNAVFYLTKTGCQWRQLPTNFPPWSTVQSFYRRAREKGIWQAMMDRLVQKSRKSMGRTEKPTYAIIDSQSVKTSAAAKDRGIDGGKKNKRTQAAYRHRYARPYIARESPCGEHP